MSVLVNTQNEQEEKVLLAFLDSLHYKYGSDLSNEQIKLMKPLLINTTKKNDGSFYAFEVKQLSDILS